MMGYAFKVLGAVAALIIASATATAEETRLLPVDEAAGDITWTRFKSRLLDALAKHDQKVLLGIVDSRIRNISAKNGLPEFRKLWDPSSSDSPLWTELPSLLFLGGAFVKRGKGPPEFCAPYVYYKWPDDASTAADAAIIAKEVLLKAGPSAFAETKHTLSYDLVKVLDWEVADDNKDSRQKWVKIQSNNDSGYVPEEQIRSPLEHRACFVKTGANWRMTSFEVGE